MTWDWRKVVSALFNGRDYLKPACPICHNLLREVPGTNDKECKYGHRFGPKMERADLPNEGDHHGDL